MTLRWRKRPRPTGLARIGAGDPGEALYLDGDKEVAQVYPEKYSQNWYWVAREDSCGIPWTNTCQAPVGSREAAKKAARAYVEFHLKKQATSKK